MNDESPQEAFDYTLWVGLAIVIVVVVATLFFAYIKPELMKQERAAVEQSLQYRQAQLTQLQTEYNAYLTLADDILKAKSEQKTDLVSAYESQQKSHLQGMLLVFNKLGGIDKLRSDSDFTAYIQFYEQLDREQQ